MKKPIFRLKVYTILLGISISIMVAVIILEGSVDQAIEESGLSLLAQLFLIVSFLIGVITSYLDHIRSIKSK